MTMERSTVYVITMAAATATAGPVTGGCSSSSSSNGGTSSSSSSSSSSRDYDPAQRTTAPEAQQLVDATAPAEANGPDEIAALSDRIRQALECPVCMDVQTDLHCLCPNGHAVCRQCTTRMLASDVVNSCPMCRSRLYSCLSGWLTAMRTMMALEQLRVACRYREHGCRVVNIVAETVRHEASCPYYPDVRCLVTGCHWLGTRDLLYAHVSQRHPRAVARTEGDRLEVTDMNRITMADRRAYLVKTERGDDLLWVLMSRMSRNRIQTGVFAVRSRQPTARPHDDGADRLVGRITFNNPSGRPATQYKRCKTLKVGRWRSSLENAADHDGDDKAASFARFRCRDEGVVISWFERAAVRRPRVQGAAVPRPTAATVTSASLAATERAANDIDAEDY